MLVTKGSIQQRTAWLLLTHLNYKIQGEDKKSYTFELKVRTKDATPLNYKFKVKAQNATPLTFSIGEEPKSYTLKYFKYFIHRKD